MTARNTGLHISPHDNYVKSVFSECGLQLDSGGKVVQMALDMSATPPRRPADTTYRDTGSPTLKKPKLQCREGKEEGGGEAEDTERMQMSSSSPPTHVKKTKTYMMPPMEDPYDEQKRRNAVTAWRNRIQKKKQNEDLQKKVNMLEETNKRLYGDTQRMEEDKNIHLEEVNRLRNTMAELQSVKCSLETSLQAHREKLTFIREHILLIHDSIDDNDPCRRVLTALLERVNSSSASPLASLPSRHTQGHMALSDPVYTSSPRARSPPRHIQGHLPDPVYTSSPRDRSPLRHTQGHLPDPVYTSSPRARSPPRHTQGHTVLPDPGYTSSPRARSPPRHTQGHIVLPDPGYTSSPRARSPPRVTSPHDLSPSGSYIASPPRQCPRVSPPRRPR